MEDALLALVVNAGGKSRRMGVSKALLPVPPLQEPMIVHIGRRLLPLVTDRVVIVTQDTAIADAACCLVREDAPALHVVADHWKAAGPLGGIATGLAHCRAWAMMVACDMPQVDAAIFTKLWRVAQDAPLLDAVIPRVGEQAQPFHGLWHRRALPTLMAQLARGELGVQRALAKLQVAWLDEAALEIAADYPAFYNVNTAEEWAQWLAQQDIRKGQ